MAERRSVVYSTRSLTSADSPITQTVLSGAAVGAAFGGSCRTWVGCWAGYIAWVELGALGCWVGLDRREG